MHFPFRCYRNPGFPVLGVGSMCRRHVEATPASCASWMSLIALGSSPTRLHLFGLKTTGIAELRGHPRIASVDSQAYGVSARQTARKGVFSKTNTYLAQVMSAWYRRQKAILAAPARPFRVPERPVVPPVAVDNGAMPAGMAARLAKAAEDLRALYEAGEIEWPDLDPQRVWEFAFA